MDLCRMHGFLPNIVYNVNNASSLVYNLHEKNDVFICDRYHKDTDCLHIVSRQLQIHIVVWLWYGEKMINSI